MLASRVKEKKFAWGGRILAAAYPAYGSVSFVGSIAGGGRLAGSNTLAGVHAEMLLEGTNRRSKKELQILLDGMGASLGFSATGDRLAFAGRVRTVHAQKLFALVAEILSEPAFPEAELAVLKAREEAHLSLAGQEPNVQAKIGLSRLIFAKRHPNRLESIEEARAALKKVSRKSLSALHAKMLSRRSLVLAVAGDMPPPRVFALAGSTFASLPDKKVILPSFRRAVPGRAKRIVVPIKHKASVTYSAGAALGITDDHPDYAPLLLGLQILGSAGGFVGRLMSTVREKEGLTYGTYSYIPGSSISNTTDGYAEVWATFAPQLFKQGRAAVLREVKKIVEEGASEDEVRRHRELLVARFKVRLSNSAAFARMAHDLAIEGRPVSYADQFLKKIMAVRAAQVHAALKKYLALKNLSESAAGPVEKEDLTSVEKDAAELEKAIK